MSNKLYPLKFEPILKEKIWGGYKLHSVLKKGDFIPNIGESWEISDVEGNSSIVKNGELKKQSLKSIISEFKGDLIGDKNYNMFPDKFPLLIKFIDAKQDLSIQLHPNDKLAKKRHNTFGKTEMWYVMQADKEANLIVGFKNDITEKQFTKHLEDKTLPDILNLETVNEGDAYFIEAGRVHAIGAGVLLAEIQQTSDVTYRLYDWERFDKEGNSRALHTDLAIDAIDFNLKKDFKIDYSKIGNKSNKMISCPYFTTNYLTLESEIYNKKNTFDSFIIYICVSGEAVVNANNFSEIIKKGETVLLPAAIKSFNITAKKAKLLEVYV